MLAVGAGGGLFGHFFLSSFLSSFSLSLEDGPIQTEILSQRAVKPKTINQTCAVTCVKCELYFVRSLQELLTDNPVLYSMALT